MTRPDASAVPRPAGPAASRPAAPDANVRQGGATGVCSQCGGAVRSSRSTARFCSPRCRAAASRDRQRARIVAELGRVEAAVAALAADVAHLVEIVRERKGTA